MNDKLVTKEELVSSVTEQTISDERVNAMLSDALAKLQYAYAKYGDSMYEIVMQGDDALLQILSEKLMKKLAELGYYANSGSRKQGVGHVKVRYVNISLFDNTMKTLHKSNAKHSVFYKLKRLIFDY